jgi:DNA-binding CsgD family transcriptional regulator
MTLRLSRAQVEQVRTAIRLLSSPMEHATVDAWRLAVNRHMKTMLRADTAGFVLPVPDGPLLFSEEHDPGETAKFGELLPPDLPDGRSVWARGIELGVVTMDTVYDGDPSPYYSSPYYNEFAGPNGAAQTLGAMMTLGAHAPKGAAALQLWRNQRNPERFGQADIDLLKLVFPALQVGVENYIRYGSDTAEFLRVCDDLGSALLICDTLGRVVHQTPALDRLLDSDPESHDVRLELRRVAGNLSRILLGAGATSAAMSGDTRLEKSTGSARYVMRASSMHASWTTGPWIMVSLDRVTRKPAACHELRARFGLTEAEARVAVLLVAGRNTKEIACDLRISWSTVRRHTERVYQKAGVNSRAGLVAKGLTT